MTILVVGASGATGRLLVEELLRRDLPVRAIVRTPDKLPETVRKHPLMSIVQAAILDLSDDDLARTVQDCTAVASCLGHNLTIRGIFGPPHRLVTDAVRRLCQAIRATQPRLPVRFVLMNTAGNRNRDILEPLTFAERSVLGLIRLLVPPHADNEHAADYLRLHAKKPDDSIEWVVVRPDTLIEEACVTGYDVHPSPTRSAIFNAGRTSRIHVAHFMAGLMSDDALWAEWKGRMPVIYNKGF